ncbi:MAG TPA: YciI family protein [Gaiellaceae bacterium]|nr:YciI family protein [Gaiellaceae bacterium]
MSLFAVIREAGPTWQAGGIFEQPSVTEHAAFMNTLADQRFVLFGGPLAGTEQGYVRVLLIVDADSEAAIHRRLADDPWATTGQLRTVSIEPWKILVGAEQLPSPHDVQPAVASRDHVIGSRSLEV